MHYENHLFWERCKWKYEKYFTDPSRVVEFGASYINGTIQAYFRCKDYTGVDWKKGYGVKVKAFCHEFAAEPESFDTVASASMIEHDVHWQKSLLKMVELMKPDGILMISWGAALNPPHCPIASVDGGYYARKAEEVIALLEDADIYIHEFQYERTILEANGDLVRPGQGLGEVVLVGFKDEDCSIGERLVDPLLDEDKI
jgi:SAM-dependent methyltransferase